MPTIAIRLDPEKLANPDADLRYRLPELFNTRSGGAITDDGYDYIGEQAFLVVFLKASDLKTALADVLTVIESVPVLGSVLHPGAVVAVKRKKGYEVVYPRDFVGDFLLD